MLFRSDVSKISGNVILGFDPEHSKDQQLINDIGFFSQEEIKKMNVKPVFLKNEFWESKNGNLLFRNR